MKNKLIIESNDGKGEFQPLIKIEAEDGTFIIYTALETNDCDEIICYAGKYDFSFGSQSIKPINDKETLEYLDGILIQVEGMISKKESSE